MDLVYRGVGDIVGWPPARIDKPFQCGKTTHVPLQEYILFHAAYATALRCANGIEFRPGVHGRGRWLYAALFGKPAS
jgi:murein L,D-transpeptidase YcbB/YkuD